MKSTQLIDYFQRARNNSTLAVVEGVQALKHAARFKAEFEIIITSELSALQTYLDELAPDTKSTINAQVEVVTEDVFDKLSPQPPRTKVIAVAKRRAYQLSDLDVTKRIVLLEDPRDLENIGAVIRVCAAADIAAVCITGPADIWHPGVLRGAAGLHFALPVLNTTLEEMLALKRELISLDPTGNEIRSHSIPQNAILIFGTERHGISKRLLKQSDTILRLPMKQGVSSLNLATSVAATLYSNL